MPSAQPIEVTLSDLTIRGLRSAPGSTNRPAVLCLHGWLDNANSFAPMLPLLPALDCVAIDLPGHGLSDHFQHNVPYTIATAAHYVLQTADALGWDDFHIIGHSLGGCIAPVCALIAEHRVKSISMIDALGPISEPDDAIAPRLKRFHHEMKLRAQTSPRIFTEIQQAVQSRLHAAQMDPESARLIIERQLQPVTGGWQWRFDAKLRAASPNYFTELQVQSMLRSVCCRTLCIVAREGHLATFKQLDNRAQCVDKLTLIELTGKHHLHMDNPLPVANAINQFFAHSITE